MSTFLDTMKRREALERVNGARGRLSALRRQLDDDLHAARADRGPVDFDRRPMLSDAGLAAHREKLASEARARHRRAFDELQAQVERDTKALLEHATALRPQPGADALSAQRQLSKWEQVKMRLDAGMTLRTVVAGAEDVDTLLAVREWAPAYLEAQAFATAPGGTRGTGLMAEPWQAPDTTSLMRSIDDRLATVVGGDVAEALEAAREVDAVVAGWGPTAAHVEQILDGTSSTEGGLDAAVAAHYAEQQARAGMPVPDDEDAAGDDGPAAA